MYYYENTKTGKKSKRGGDKMNKSEESKAVKSRYVPTSVAAKLVHLSEGTLANHRTARTGLPYSKVGGRVLYDVYDIQKYLEGKKIVHE
jgi:hypothetical protein